ncbi:FliA/WhiG family RNA polymerase sigma factor [Peptoanaerobacter stomatis]|uniref:FliA/WhiG family RNA polymerase sigma factor n=1 Tax=Peptoanaerobacter stomatis TaxID=796937 RepID=J4W615_9FIRM|nr:FliA/WhiG family RNA polymerase sigma factor [Peptoanaerobacter stomatis]EHL17261.1 FliA/WhiG family RNA polymerase sigma factor [Peptoanaerobacter stomatis]EJU21406.1 RNA polymerase sigma factor, FliA/WhiG family [Peptoanaerobacter stomatis]NWO24766.1 FliA/WhiG family RNA polymerase sigma factor [Peptostreptococcaceae bacterium oral taxon 081]
MNENASIWFLYEKETDELKKKQLKEEIITNYIGLVKIVSGKLFNYYAQKIEYDDLMGYGVIGLIDAIDKYDYTKNIKFETYASIRIRGEIIDQIRNLDWIPRSIRKKMKTLNTTIEKLESQLGREATRQEISEYMQISLKEVDELFEETTTYNIVSIEDEITENYKLQIMDDKKENSPEENLIYKDTIKELAKAIDTLKEKEKLVINLYYYENLTYKEISEIVGVSESRISQIISSCLIKIKKILNQ